MDEEEIKLKSDDELEEAATDDILKLYIKDIRRYPLIPAKEQSNLALLYKRSGDLSAREKLINSNLRLVVSLAFNFLPLIGHLKILDIIQEGNIGLIRALDNYDPEKGNFSSYAGKIINNQILEAIYQKESEIKQGKYFISSKNKYFKLLSECKQKNIPIPSDDEICKRLDISQVTLDLIKDSSKLTPISMNKLVDDEEEKSELGDFVADNRHDYEDFINRENHLDLFNVLKEVLTPPQYFVIYHRLLSDERKTLGEVAAYLGITSNSVGQLEKRTLKKLKPYMAENSELFAKVLFSIKNKEGEKYRLLRKTPISPINIIKYLYVENDLTDLEKKLYELDLLGRYKYSYQDLANLLNVSLDELNSLISSLKSKINKKLSDRESYKHFRDLMIKSHTTQIFEIDIHHKENDIDYSTLEERYESCSLEDILAGFQNIKYELTVDEQSLLESYFGYYDKVNINDFEIEKEVNLVKFGFKNRSNRIPYKKLYQEYIKAKDEFTLEQQLYLESYVFGKVPRKVFNETIPNSTIKKDAYRLINRLERRYYHIYEYFYNDFSKTDWLAVKSRFSDRFTPDKIEMMDLYFGVEGSTHTRKELESMYGKSREELNSILQPTLEKATNLYCGIDKRIEIDKNLYIPYLLKPYYDIVTETKELLELFLVANKSYEEINELYPQLSTTKISNIITSGIRRIDNYRFGIIPCRIFTTRDLSDFFNACQAPISEDEKEIIKMRFLKYKDNQAIASEKNMDPIDVNHIISRFNTLYYSYKIKDVEVSEREIKLEVDKHKSESILNEKQRELASLVYGFKNKWNSDGVKFSKVDVMEKMNLTSIGYDNTLAQIKSNIRGYKAGLISPENLHIPRSKLDEILDDTHLPISEKGREIICHLFELKGYSYMTIDELALKYKHSKSDIKVRYQRAIVSIYRYLNKEIEGIIDYETDIVPLLKYFGTSDREKLNDLYNNKLTLNEMAKKYNLSSSQISRISYNLKYQIHELINNPDAKKFDFDFYLKNKDNPDLPFYGDLDLAIKIFDLTFGMNGEEKLAATEIVKKLNLDVDVSTINRIIANLMLSFCKLSDGITKIRSFSYDEIYNYYSNNDVPNYRKDNYENYFRRAREKKTVNGLKEKISNNIIADLIIATYPDAFTIDNATEGEVKQILKEHGRLISKRVRRGLMGKFGIREREYMSGKDINHVFRLLHTLDEQSRKLDSNKILSRK